VARAHTEVVQQQRQRLGVHRAAVVGVQDELFALDTLTKIAPSTFLLVTPAMWILPMHLIVLLLALATPSKQRTMMRRLLQPIRERAVATWLLMPMSPSHLANPC